MKVIDNRAVSVYALFRKELENLYPADEIETFLFFSFSEYFGFSRSDMVLKKDMRLSESELLKFFRVIRKLKLHVPVQYILGHTEFYGLDFKVNEAVLIPRPETEELVEWVLEGTKGEGRGAGDTLNIKHQTLNILDVGTGSGCIAIALKKNMPDAEVYALDISEKALVVAKVNAEKNNTAINFIHADILKPTFQPSNLPAFQLLISNPPYITEAEKPAMHPNVLEHEPHTALFVTDNDALLFYRAILDFAKERLAADGKIYFELNANYASEIAALAKEKGFVNCEVRKDLSGKERMMRCGKG